MGNLSSSSSTARGAPFEAVRLRVDERYSRLCHALKEDISHRLRSGDDRRFDAAFWELYRHEWGAGARRDHIYRELNKVKRRESHDESRSSRESGQAR